MAALRVFLLCVFAAIFYGEIHDQVTAHLCVEYFSVAHPKVIASQSPFLLAIVWGVIATWWVGAFLGIGLVIAARAGKRQPWGVAELFRPIGILLFAMFAIAFLAGLSAYIAMSAGWIWLAGGWADVIPPERHIWFMVDAWSHLASYASGFLGEIILWIYTWRQRLSY